MLLLPGSATGSAWNQRRVEGNEIVHDALIIPPYSSDSDTRSFSRSELSNIVAIWGAVAEDFVSFDVDVTTIPQAGINPSLYMRVMIGGDGAWYTETDVGLSGVGGAAFLVSSSWCSWCSWCSWYCCCW